MSDTTIDVGDRVVVTFQSGDQVTGEVLYIPVATGDCWHIKGEHGLYYVQTFESIWRANQ